MKDNLYPGNKRDEGMTNNDHGLRRAKSQETNNITLSGTEIALAPHFWVLLNVEVHKFLIQLQAVV